MDPAELRHWLGLHELLRLRGADDAAALVAHAAQVLGHSHPDLAAGSPRGLGAQALSPSVLGQIAPRGALYAIADLLRALGPALAHHLPFDYPSEPILASIARELAPPVTAEFGLGELQLSRCEPNLCLPLSAAPLQVCLGGAWLEKASDAERAFAILRAVGIAKLDLHLLTRCAPERFGLVLNALWSIADRTHMVVVLDATEQNRVATALAASLDSSQHARTKQLIDAIVEHEEINPRRLQSAALDYGARIALCTTGDLWAGLSCLLGLRGRQASTLGQSAKLELCRTDPALRGLLRFAISEAYAQARRFCVQKPAPERV
jgi:hypothetical protein